MTTEMNFTNAIVDRIKEIDARDESQIMMELAGETVSEMFYTTEVYDRKLKRMAPKVKLSWAGSKEAARSKGNIVVDDAPIVTDLEDSVRVVVRVTDLARNFTIFGGCHQPKKMRINDYDPKTKQQIGYHLEDDAFYFQKGLSKAQRNAFQTILPADFIAKCLERFLRLSAPRTEKQIEKPKEARPPTKAEEKARTSWEAVTQEMVPDYPHLERVFWDILKKQPADMYRELGVSGRADMNITAWAAFQQLKAAHGEIKTTGHEIFA